MASVPCLLPESSYFLTLSLSSSKNARIRNHSLQCSCDAGSVSSDAVRLASTGSKLDRAGVREEQLGRRLGGLDGRAGCVVGLGAIAGTMLAFPHHANAAEVASSLDAWSALVASEPKNALSLPTWVIHVASVAEWITAMALVWRYGDTPGNSTWKGLSWGMVPLLGGAMCACTWHFFYNATSLEILVVLQALLTVIGNFTMWIAAFRIYQSSQKQSKSS